MEEEEELGWWCPYSLFPIFLGVEPFPLCRPLHHPTSLHPRARWRRRRAWWRRSTSPPARWSSSTTAPPPPPPTLMGLTRESTTPALTQVTCQTWQDCKGRIWNMVLPLPKTVSGAHCQNRQNKQCCSCHSFWLHSLWTELLFASLPSCLVYCEYPPCCGLKLTPHLYLLLAATYFAGAHSSKCSPFGTCE